MSPNEIYLLGTLLIWGGWIGVARFVYLAARRLAKLLGSNTNAADMGMLLSGGLGAIALIIGSKIPKQLGPGVVPEPGVRLPLVWWVMPYSGWLAAGCVLFAIIRAVQGCLAIDPNERSERIKSIAGWLIATLVFAWLYKRDPADKIELIRGGIPFSFEAAVGIVVLLSVATIAMIWAGRATATRGFSKAVVIQAALITGSIIYALPLAFLVITSFKEDQDMSSPNGIVWVPHVQDTVPFYDKSDPLYQGSYQGKTVQATVIRREPNGQLHLDIQSPLAIRGTTFDASLGELKELQKEGPVVTGALNGQTIVGYVDKEMDDGTRRVLIQTPAALAGTEHAFEPTKLTPVRHVGLKVSNYTDALSYLPPETNNGLVYLQNTLIIVILSVIGTILSSAVVSYAFSRMRFPGRDFLFTVLLSTMMLPGAVTLMPQFLIFRWFGWIDTLLPLWAPAFVGSAFNIFLLRQFFMQIPLELEDAAKIDGCSYVRTFWRIMMPQIKPALAVVAVTTFVGSWNNFMGPLIYITSPEHMPLSYALQLFQSDRNSEPGMQMAFATLCMAPVIAVFFFAQRYFIEGVTLSGLGGR